MDKIQRNLFLFSLLANIYLLGSKVERFGIPDNDLEYYSYALTITFVLLASLALSISNKKN